MNRLVTSFVLALVVSSILSAGAFAADIEHRLVEMDDGRPSLRLVRDGAELVAPKRVPLYTDTPCEVTVRAEATPEGVLLHYRITNPTDEPATIPVLQVGGITLPGEGAEIVEPWQTIRFVKSKKLTPHRYYPGSIYSPVMGVRQGGTFVGTAAIYDLFGTMRSLRIEYDFDKKKGWTLCYHFNAKREGYRKVPGDDVLEPGESLEATVSVGVAPGADPKWVTAFRAYRDHFKQTYGEPRYKRSVEPILAWPSSLASALSDENPRGFLHNSGFRKGKRMDEVGWKFFEAFVEREAIDKGFRRLMIWNPTGLYREHRSHSMTWEIGTAWTEAQRETKERFIEVCRRKDMSVGIWWGRATSVSGGFDSGHRHAFDPDNPDDWKATFAEIDPLYEMGVRMIGMDATSRGIRPRPDAWRPSSRVLFEQWFPRMTKRYPEMRWMVEPAANDYLHLWGSSFIYSDRCTGPRHFAEYLNPEQETNVVVKRSKIGRGKPRDAMQKTIDKYIEWGYTPLVFLTGFYPYEIDRETIEKRAGQEK
jgi:hypothetical protein